MKSDVTVILNGYKRPERLKEQVDAVMGQTIPPKDILYWQNSMPNVNYDYSTINRCVHAIANVNFGVWARFFFAMNARTNWICVLDDDTIPGSRWFENCLETQKTHPGLHGTIGILFPNGEEYHNVYRVGWDNPNEEVKEVFCVGHCWFFHRDLLSIFTRELPDLDQPWDVGEDMHFSFMLQKYSNYRTYVPPHPKNNKELWGSLKGWQYGDDGNATASVAMDRMRATLKKYVSRGYIINNMPSNP